MPLYLALGMALCGCEMAPAPPKFSMVQESWSFGPIEGHKIVTDHFDIHSTLVDAELEAALPSFLESAHREYRRLLPQQEGKPRLQTYVFNNRAQWEAFTRMRFPESFQVYRRITAGGYAHGNLCVVYYIQRPYTLSVLAHEGMHQYFGNNFDVTLPAWLNEGLATYAESFELAGGQPVFTPRHNTFRLNALREALTTDSILPLKEMLATDAGKVLIQGQSRLVQTYYAQVWAMTVFLRHGAGGRYASGFDRILAEIVSGELPRTAQAARISAPSPSKTSYGEAIFRAHITTDLETFEQEFKAYMIELAGFSK